jgi:choline dehydrogenase-like flavoprotein
VRRRDLLKLGVLAGASASVRGVDAARGGPSQSAPQSGDSARQAAQPTSGRQNPPNADADYIVIGSGAGGGTVAARLAESGFRVLVLEAGSDPRSNARPEDYDVPAFHPSATENPSMRWDFWVRHYENDAQQRRDPKYHETWNGKPADGIWYPRAGTLGGCTAHNAMILTYPHDADWNELADLTGDSSWKPERMREYFRRIENCHHRPLERLRSRFGTNPSRHGYSGWLHTEHIVPESAFRDRDLRKSILDSARAAVDELGSPLGVPSRAASLGDPNDARSVADAAVGLRYLPLTTHDRVRIGSRDRLLDVQRRYPDHLKIEMHALATRVLFDADNRAVGVEYLSGERLYRADPQPSQTPGEVRQRFASKEIILAGGAFNTPQLLMLSGIGDREALERLKIPVRVDLPGVGTHLQDRYEVALVHRMAFEAWRSLAGATFTTDDAQYREWRSGRKGVYSTNGSPLSVIASSGPGRPSPDLFCYALLAKFAGYAPGYSQLLPQHPNYFSWIVLKGHTNNVAGRVWLRSADPRDPPAINFHYFDEGSDATGDDLRAVVEGLKLARRLARRLKDEGLVAEEELPGETVDDDTKLRQFVRDQAWGHHASCTCRIGARELGGVLSSDFRVHGTTGLRVVDASVFPRVPGLFIVSAVYMIGEKAADVIMAAAGGR